MAGETGSISLPLPISMTIAGLFAMACLNCAEIGVLVFYTFKRYAGLYFWSMLVATMGTIFYAIVNLLRLFALAPNFPMAVLLALSWWAMVTGQSVVLYSRLHLVVSNRKIIRRVLIMIITNFFIIHIPLTILWLGCNLDPDYFLLAFNVYERLQLVAFFIQESIISGLYIWKAGRDLKPILAVKDRAGEKVTRQLIIINSLVILLDISLIITEYTGNLYIQTSYQPLVYSIKLKMEFIILNKLIDLIQRPQCNGRGPPAENYTSSRAVPGNETNLASPEANNGGSHGSTRSSGPRESFDIDYGA
ncbi:hypothetical protein B0J12DRAFT_715002 [Macrophomina phaseolina]|uniref:DUF7703 domain-containing protein n=1 Tax=Macrophomina phaseolina TaxID=35725 RepID=A0ABQ8FPH9_9PEZI|nr:hypothetical protein B0J12DRAFT_715002 [Macrophomina phaseolina]